MNRAQGIACDLVDGDDITLYDAMYPDQGSRSNQVYVPHSHPGPWRFVKDQTIVRPLLSGRDETGNCGTDGIIVVGSHPKTTNQLEALKSLGNRNDSVGLISGMLVLVEEKFREIIGSVISARDMVTDWP